MNLKVYFLCVLVFKITILQSQKTPQKAILTSKNNDLGKVVKSNQQVKEFVNNNIQFEFPYINVLSHNVKSNSKDDQSDIIQSIIDRYGKIGTSEGKVIFFPSGIYRISKKIKLRNGITAMGEGQNSTVFLCTGEQAGFSLIGKNQSIKNLKITTQSEFKKTVAVDIYGDNSRVQEVSISGNFEKGIYIHADNQYENTYSFNTKISDVDIREIKNIAIEVEHCIDTYLSSVSIYNKRNDTNAVSLLVNTGTSGLYVNRVVCGFGKHSLKVQHNLYAFGTNRSPGWKSAPVYLFFDQFIADTNTGGDAILFDSTLKDNVTSCVFNNSWAAFAGKREDGTTFRSNACGIHIQGGSGISFNGGRIRLNCGDGVLISSAFVKYIKIQNNFITSNNVANQNASGININAAASFIDISNNTIGNVLDNGGNQLFGISIFNGAMFLTIVGNTLWQNLKSTINNNTPFEVSIVGNVPDIPNSLQSGVKIANNPLNSGVKASALEILPNNKHNISSIDGGILVLRNIDDGKSAVFLIESTGGTKLIAGDSIFVVGKPLSKNKIGIDTKVSETLIHNSFDSKKIIAFSVFQVQGAL